MLIVSRRREESVKIGDDVFVRVLEIKEGRVKLGIEAPSETRVLRVELKEKESMAAKKTSGKGAWN